MALLGGQLSVTHSFLWQLYKVTILVCVGFAAAISWNSEVFPLLIQLLKKGRHVSQLNAKERKAMMDDRSCVCQEKTPVVLFFSLHVLRATSNFTVPRKESGEKNNAGGSVHVWKVKKHFLQTDAGLWFTTTDFKEGTGEKNPNS